MSKRIDASTEEGREEIVRFFCAAGDRQRLELLFLLACEGPQKAGAIAERSPLSRTAVSHHLHVLKDAGLVTSQKRATEITYSFDEEGVVGRLQAVIDAIQSCKE